MQIHAKGYSDIKYEMKQMTYNCKELVVIATYVNIFRILLACFFNLSSVGNITLVFTVICNVDTLANFFFMAYTVIIIAADCFFFPFFLL